MYTYTPRTFTIPTLEGFSTESVTQHLRLYEGYVKNFTDMCALMGELMIDSARNAHALSELQRRLSFEFDGMRNHEYYFEQFDAGPKALDPESAFSKAAQAQWKGMDIAQLMKSVAKMRGPGWAMLYLDPVSGVLHPAFVGEQHQGHLVGLPVMLAIDVWEHAYVLDHGALGKGTYLDAFFRNLNWEVVEKRFAALRG